MFFRGRLSLRSLAPATALVIELATPIWADYDAGVAAYHQGDHVTAFEEFNPLANQGYAPAQYSLGTLYEDGRGIPQDYTEAVKWYRLAANQHYAPAQYKLGTLCEGGKGVPQDHAEAVKWYRLAANQHYAPAQYKLRGMEQRLHGVRHPSPYRQHRGPFKP